MSSGQKIADEMLTHHPAYETDDRIGNRWFQGRYRPGIREWGYPIRLPREQWTPLPKMRVGLDNTNINLKNKGQNYEEIEQRSGRNDRFEQSQNNGNARNVNGSDASSVIR